MTTKTQPYLDPDGTQVYPVDAISLPSSFAGATGEIRWDPVEGLRFCLELPHESEMAAVPPMHGAGPTPQPGQLSEVPDQPAWTGTLTDGSVFRLFAPNGTSYTIHTPGDGTYTSRTLLRGRAAFAEVEIPKASALSFWHLSPQCPRYFFAGLHLLPFPHDYAVTYTENGTHTRSACWCLILTESPKLQIIPCAKVGVLDGCWMAYDGEAPANIRLPPAACEDARAFISFLVGRNIPFLWTDRFLAGDRLVRMFHGTNRPPATVVGNEQPLPIGVIADTLEYGTEICPRLPALFEKFKQVRAEYNLAFISSPIWTAFDSYVDDRLTYACVSLERLATAHADWREQHPESGPAPEIFLTESQGKVIRDLFRASLKAIATALAIPAGTLKVLIDKRINNIHMAPNADKLKQVFTDLGIPLTAEEDGALSNRNRTLHGNPTLRSPTLVDVAAESKRFDTLRTLINKALLRLLEYSGPYMDYGDRPPDKGFSIKTMAPVPPPAAGTNGTGATDQSVAPTVQPASSEPADAVPATSEERPADSLK
ncbi:MAG: hypothetical protein JNM56_00675 [Planctomycetia bacterium]|nr:hypothetical protein [Planctomycetia bacterium]